MNNYIFNAIRDIIHDAIEEDFISEDGIIRDICECESLNIRFTDIGLAVQIGGNLFGIAIEQV